MPDGGVPGGGMQDLVSTQKSGVKYLGQIYQILNALFPRINGTFTLNAATSTAVADTRVQANSVISFTPRNAAAATLIGGVKSPYISAVTAGVGFTVTCASGSAAGNEQFTYMAVNPV
jgi:hypothetical protein